MLRNPQFTRADILTALAQELDVPAHLIDRAETEYSLLGEWLCKPGSGLLKYTPSIYPQGSFRLGTTIKPINDADDYDIDSVCRLVITHGTVSQKELKAMVGARLDEHPEYRRIKREGSRCWILDFPDGFHMDILPAIPNPPKQPNGILITDKLLFRWQHSNPIDYSAWFREQMLVQYNEQRNYIAKSLQVAVEDVPEWRVRTPLQRVVQLLKRHRDVMFQDDDDKPISIIITTLAAHAYENNDDLETALLYIIRRLPNAIEDRDGVKWVSNPVDPQENFADKWQIYPEREAAFYAWHERLEQDFFTVQKAVGIDGVSEELSKFYGARVVERAVKRIGDEQRIQREQGQLRMITGSGLLATTTAVSPASAVSRPVPRHTFYGGYATQVDSET